MGSHAFCFELFRHLVCSQEAKFHGVAAISTAYLFTFNLTVAAQISHIQLAPRFMVPVAFWMAIRFLDTGRANYLHLLLAACAYQIYLGIYTGYFLILSIIPFWLALFLIRKQWIAVGSFIEDSERRLLFHRALGYATSGIAFVLVLLPLAIPYYQTQRLMGCWAWDEVVIMLPRWRSYL
jgi:hypothetical protein